MTAKTRRPTPPTPAEMAALTRRLRARPVTDTGRAHAKLIVALGLALKACDELHDETETHECLPDDEEGKCLACSLYRDAQFMPYQLNSLHTLLENDSSDNCRLDHFAGKLNDVLGEWLDRDRESGNPPTPDAIR